MNCYKEPVFERIEMLFADRGKSQQELLELLGLHRCTYSNWSLGKSKSYLKHIDVIADYFGVSARYLLRGVDDRIEETKRAPEEDELLRLFRDLSPLKRQCIIQVTRTLLIEGREEKNREEEVG